MARALDLINQKFDQPLRVDDIARHAGLSAFHFSRLFRKAIGRSPHAYLTAAPVVKPVAAPRAGVITTMSTRDLGVAIVELGGGRRKAGDAIDMRVGFSEVKPLGTRVAAGEPLALIHAADDAAADRAIASYLAACSLGDADVAATPMVMAEVG